MSIFLKACINGARLPDQHPALPLTAEAIANDAKAVVAAGADAIHFHVRNPQRVESLDSRDVFQCLDAVRRALPSTPLGISTGDWIVPDTEQRLKAIREWTTLPDFVSVNFHEEGAQEIATMLHARGVGIELGLTFPFSTEIALSNGWGSRCLRVLLEPMEAYIVDARATVAEIERLLDAAGVSVPRLLHGGDLTAWPLLIDAAKRGYQCRIGLEDTLTLPDGKPAENNAQIIRTARGLIAQVG